MNRPICDCGICLTCRCRERGRRWREAHPEHTEQHRVYVQQYRQTHPRQRKKPFVHPTAARMDAMAEQVWARHAAPWYYDTGIRVVAEHRAVSL